MHKVGRKESMVGLVGREGGSDGVSDGVREGLREREVEGERG